MIKLKKILKNMLIERTVGTYEVHDMSDDLEHTILNNFLYKNNEDMTKNVPWPVIKFNRLKKIWEDFMKIGHVRDERGFDVIEDIMIQNTLKIHIFTKLTGHTEADPDPIFREEFEPYLDKFIAYYFNKDIDPNQYQMNFNTKTGKALKSSLPKMPEKFSNKYLENYIEEKGLNELPKKELKEELYDALMERFMYYYCEDPDSGQAYMSDYGLEPLLNHMSKLIKTHDYSEKLYTIDKMLNVVHQRSDLASWFVEGGSKSLSKLSGTEDEND